jgi:Tol biopolymer transport system component/serine/threonine protein kinase
MIQPGANIGRYHIVAPLGQGGMAEVYRAYDTRLECEVAIKVIRRDAFAPSVLDEVLQRFQREARALAQLNHPNIVKVTDYDQYESIPYLVMPFLAGGTLKEQMRQRSKDGGAYSPDEAARLLAPVARALEYAHQRGVLHRDVKPANILLTDSGAPLLADFGIARLLASGEGNTLTATGMGIGTPEYMAPEQGMGQPVPASDQYALGVILYELLTGRKPYTADTPIAVLFKHASDPLPPPRQFAPGITPQAERMLYTVLAKQPENRYPSMSAYALALEQMQGQPPAAAPQEETPQVNTTPPETQTVVSTPPPAPIVNEPTWLVSTGSAKPQTEPPPPNDPLPVPQSEALTVDTRTVVSTPPPAPIAEEQTWLGSIDSNPDQQPTAETAPLSTAEAIPLPAQLYENPAIEAHSVVSPLPPAHAVFETTSPDSTPNTKQEKKSQPVLPPPSTTVTTAPPARGKWYAVLIVLVILAALVMNAFWAEAKSRERVAENEASFATAVAGATLLRQTIVTTQTAAAEIVIRELTAISKPTGLPTRTASATPTMTLKPTIAPTSVPTALGGGSGKIAFMSERDKKPAIFIMDADGGNLFRLSDNPPINWFPSWSPDGKQIIFFGGQEGKYFQIYVMEVGGATLTRLTDNKADCYNPTWSPDGRRIAFVSNWEGNDQIYMMDADGSNLSRLTELTGFMDIPRWSPDGKHLAFVLSQGNNHDIYRIDADGGNLSRLTDYEKLDTEPDWSPDGRRIAFASYRDGNYEIYVMNADGTNLTRLTNHKTSDISPAWSPDGKRIAFTSARDGHDEIYVMDVDGGNLTRLTNHPLEDRSPVWSPDGLRIAFISNRDGNDEIYVIDADGANPTRLTNHKAEDFAPVWAP